MKSNLVCPVFILASKMFNLFNFLGTVDRDNQNQKVLCKCLVQEYLFCFYRAAQFYDQTNRDEYQKDFCILSCH